MLTTTVTLAWSQFTGLAPTSQISYTTVYVPDGVFGLTVIVPSGFNVKPAGTLTPVNVTWPGLVPITTGVPSNVSFTTTLGVLSPTETAAGVSLLATIGLLTTIVAVAVSQLSGVTFNPVTGSASHNWYVMV